MKKIVMIFYFSIVVMGCNAQEYRFNKGMLKLPYQEKIFTSGQSVEKKMLVVYLHPYQARGHKNETQSKVPAYKAIAHYLDSVNADAVLLAPQCEEARHWNEYSSPIGKYLSDVVKDFIEDYANSHREIDKLRIFILGESFGGSGVWRLVTDYPNYFAAAMPAVCSPKLNRLERYVSVKKAARTPLCIVVGGKDQVYNPKVMEPYIDELKKRNCDLKYIILANLNHQAVCREAFTPEALDWLFSHTRK